MKRIVSAILILLLATTCTSARPAVTEPAPKRIILLIGDGMGPAHVAVMRIVAKPFHLARFPVIGSVATHSANDRLTDSAAAATALATGVKTNNRMVSVDPQGRRLPTVLEAAASQGRATGVVTTANFFDATPAAFASHVPKRSDGNAIIREMLDGPLNIILGAGAQVFGVESVPTIEQAAAMWKREIVASFDATQYSHDQRLIRIFPRQPNDVDFPEAPLPTQARFALDVLSKDPEGFFVMIEHEGIDTASHEHATEAMIESLLSFNETIGLAIDFAAKHPDTLVIVTGDHETGGLRFTGKTRAELNINWSTKGHTAQSVPLFAYGPGAGRFGGARDNTSIGQQIFALLKP